MLVYFFGKLNKRVVVENCWRKCDVNFIVDSVIVVIGMEFLVVFIFFICVMLFIDI